MGNMFTQKLEIKSVQDVDTLINLKGENAMVYQTMKKKDGSVVAATGGITIATANIGGYRLNIHNDVTKLGLKAVKKFLEAGSIPEKHITPTRTGKGMVIRLLVNGGDKRHNTHIYVSKPKNNNNIQDVSEDDIDW